MCGIVLGWSLFRAPKGERSGQNDSPAEEQSRMWSEDSGQALSCFSLSCSLGINRYRSKTIHSSKTKDLSASAVRRVPIGRRMWQQCGISHLPCRKQRAYRLRAIGTREPTAAGAAYKQLIALHMLNASDFGSDASDQVILTWLAVRSRTGCRCLPCDSGWAGATQRVIMRVFSRPIPADRRKWTGQPTRDPASPDRRSVVHGRSRAA